MTNKIDSQKSLMHKCHRAMNNIEDALSDLGLDTLSIQHPVQAYCSKTALEAEYSSALATAEAARSAVKTMSQVHGIHLRYCHVAKQAPDPSRQWGRYCGNNVGPFGRGGA